MLDPLWFSSLLQLGLFSVTLDRSFCTYNLSGRDFRGRQSGAVQLRINTAGRIPPKQTPFTQTPREHPYAQLNQCVTGTDQPEDWGNIIISIFDEITMRRTGIHFDGVTGFGGAADGNLSFLSVASSNPVTPSKWMPVRLMVISSKIEMMISLKSSG